MVFEVSEQEDALSLDKFVASRCALSRRLARLRIRSGAVKVNGRIVRVMQKPVRRGQKVAVLPDSPAAMSPAPTPELIHCDGHVAVVHKPAGLLSESDRHGSPSVESLLPGLLEKRGESRGRIWLVHRLDAGTSGLIVLSRRHSATRALNDAFRNGKVHKRYVALVSGDFGENRRVEVPIGRLKGTKHGVRADGRFSRTDFVVLQGSVEASLVAATLHTGRTHQIRVHASHLGHPLLGDRLYSGPGYTNGGSPEAIPRPMLHALELGFEVGGRSYSFATRPPPDFLRFAEMYGLGHSVLVES